MLDLLPVLDGETEQPAYRQIVAALRSALEAGELSAGDQLPPVRAAAAELGINFNTVARAYRVLEKEGVLESHRGRGTFVRGARESRDLSSLVSGFLRRAYRAGFDAQQVRWETSAAIRSWMQEGLPPGEEG